MLKKNAASVRLALIKTVYMSDPILKSWEKKSADHQKEYKKFLQRADLQKTLKKLPALHEEAFEKIDCLECAACCKNYSPRFRGPDIRRLAGVLRMKETEFIQKYLRADEDGDYVLTTKPCPFLGADNFCSVYEHRPGDCRRFPYTDEDVLLKRQKLTLVNSSFCPIVYFVLEKLIKDK